ncbi:MAG: ADP-ribosylglycohydrolase family protein [Ardenticatenales bacterium]|nr:ADP-ribosylglycohydrolase family protein [Ardenticatenales bacterium]
MPASNPAFLETIFRAHDVDLARGPLFDRAPGPTSPDPSFDRAAGMLLGLAIGDALGHPVAATPPAERAARWGEVRDYVPNVHAGGAALGLPSSLTQLAFWMLESVVAAGRFHPKRVVDRWSERPLFGAGTTVRDALREVRGGVPWHRCGRKSAGAGPAARVAPLLLPHLAGQSADVWADVALCTLATHNDSAALAGALGITAVLQGSLASGGAEAGPARPPAGWWADTFVDAIRGVEVEPFYTVAVPGEAVWTGRLGQRVGATVPAGLGDGLTVADAARRWGSGAYALEAIPIALFILARHADDPEAALVRAVNDTAASDVVGAIVGACVGALHGAGAWPERWVAGLSGRTAAADDGRVFAIIEAARGRWGG